MKPSQPIWKPILSLALWACLAGTALAAQPFDLDPVAPYTSNPAVATLPDGGFLAVWTRDRRVPLSFGPDAFVPEAVVWQRRRSTGEPVGPVGVALPESVEGSVQSPRVAAGPDNAQLVWSRGGGEAFLLEGRSWKRDRLAARRPLAGCPDGRVRGLRVLAVTSGSWMVWNELCDGLRILARRLAAGGRPTRDARVLVGASALPGAGFDVASTADGGFVGAWVQRVVGDYGDERVLMARAFRPDGRARRAAFRVSTETIQNPPSRPAFEPAILATPAGRIHIAWPRASDGRLVLRSFRSDGTPFGPAQPVGEAADAIEGSPRFSGVSNGLALLVWQRANAEPDAGCLARLVGERGLLGGETIIAERCPGASVALSNQRLLVAWQEAIPESGDAGIPFRARALSLALADLR